MEIRENGLVNAMPELQPLYYTSPRGQCAVMLLAALHELYVIDGYGVVPKREAIAYIKRKHWFEIEPEDQEPYQSQRWTSGEPRWYTLIAWARKDGVLRDIISHEGHDQWGLTRYGRKVSERFYSNCHAGRCPPNECFLWSKEFKKFVYPQYEPSSKDVKRPTYFYRDHCGDTLAQLFAKLAAESKS
jgi:hypothetical protein